MVCPLESNGILYPCSLDSIFQMRFIWSQVSRVNRATLLYPRRKSHNIFVNKSCVYLFTEIPIAPIEGTINNHEFFFSPTFPPPSHSFHNLLSWLDDNYSLHPIPYCCPVWFVTHNELNITSRLIDQSENVKFHGIVSHSSTLKSQWPSSSVGLVCLSVVRSCCGVLFTVSEENSNGSLTLRFSLFPVDENPFPRQSHSKAAYYC